MLSVAFKRVHLLLLFAACCRTTVVQRPWHWHPVQEIDPHGFCTHCWPSGWPGVFAGSPNFCWSDFFFGSPLHPRTLSWVCFNIESSRKYCAESVLFIRPFNFCINRCPRSSHYKICSHPWIACLPTKCRQKSLLCLVCGLSSSNSSSSSRR